MLNEILVRVVNSCGFQTISAFDGAQALTVLQQTKVDLVLMDVDGLTTVREMRRLGSEIPVIACSAAVDRQTCITAGCNDWIAKLFTRAGIASVLYKWCTARKEILYCLQI